MTPALVDHASPRAIPASGDLHVLVVARDPVSRYAICDRLLDAGLTVTLAATYGVVELLLGAGDAFDLMLAAQSAEEIGQFGVTQLARSIHPDLPILVLEFDTANAPTIVDLVQDALTRWPLRDRGERSLH